MPRAKDEDGNLLPPPHQRLENASALVNAGYLALALDGRSAIWSAGQKITVINKVIDHVVDGDAIPKRFYAKDEDDPNNRALIEMWKVVEDAVRRSRQAA